MRYKKDALSFEEQANLLIQRGLECNRDELISYLTQINYYHLSGYLYPFRETGSDNFITNTTLENIRMRVDFDSDIRLLIMKAVEKIEIAIFRTQMVEHLAQKHGPFCYIKQEAYKDKNIFPDNFLNQMIKFSSDIIQDQNTDFIKRYREKYTEEEFLPFWMIVEKMSFGQLGHIFNNLQIEDRVALSEKYQLHYKVLSSWLHTLSFIRNTCAHHGRLWRRYIPIKPKIPNNIPGFHNPIQIENSNLFGILVISQYLINFINPELGWGTQLQNIVAKYPDLPFGEIGFPANWQDVPFWS